MRIRLQRQRRLKCTIPLTHGMPKTSPEQIPMSLRCASDYRDNGDSSAPSH